MKLRDAINWFEIPALDFQRAHRFYSEIYNTELQVLEMEGAKLGILPYDNKEGVGGAIAAGEGYKPSSDGILIYLNGGENLSEILDKVTEAGGKIHCPKTKISEEIGYIGIFVDTEGNKIGLHSSC